MTCDNCGYTNLPEACFCTLYGTALEQGAYPNHIKRQVKSIQPRIPKKPGASRAVKAAVGAVMIIAAALVCLLLFAGASVTGGWYSEDSRTALVFEEDGSALLFSLAGIEEAKYSYNRLGGQGRVYFGQVKDFRVDKDSLIFDAETFKRAGEGFDAQEFVKGALYGYWSNKELAEVFEIRQGAAAILHTVNKNEDANYDYRVAQGEGVIDYNGSEAVFAASLEQIDLSGVGTFVKESKSFDLKAFMEEYGNPLKGAWYDKAGSIGRFDFLKEGAFSLLSYGTIYEGSYRFENKEAAGSLTVNGRPLDIRLDGETLRVGQWELTRKVTAQKGKESLYEQLVGVWYDASGISGTLEFFADGTTTIKSLSEDVRAYCTFSPLMGEGIITYVNNQAQSAFSLSDGKLIAGGTEYTKEFVGQRSSSLEGVWRHTGGTLGTIQFFSGGKAELELAGGRYTGTYTFDESISAGTVTAVYGGREWTFDIRLEGGSLVVKTGLFIAGDVVYIRGAASVPSP